MKVKVALAVWLVEPVPVMVTDFDSAVEDLHASAAVPE